MCCLSKVVELVDDSIVAFDHGFMEQENADTFSADVFLRDSGCLQIGATCCEQKRPSACSIFFCRFRQRYLVFHRMILRCDTEPSTRSLQDAVIQACAGVEVIPLGPLEGDHMTSGRVGKSSCGVSSFASRMTQGIFVDHHDRTGPVLCITKNEVV